MSRLHQINRFHYPEHCHDEIKLSLSQGDAILLIEEGVLRSQRRDSILSYAEQQNIPVYLLEQDALAHGISPRSTEQFTKEETTPNTPIHYIIITSQQWVEMTTKYDHIAW